MKRIFLMLIFSAITFFAGAQNYKPSDEGSKVHFIIRNFGINTGGDLAGLRGSISFDPSNLSASNFNITVDVKTINTDSDNRDEHLKGDSYFDAEKYPVILIRSTKIGTASNTKEGSYAFTGTLTIHGITKEISFPFSATPQGSDYLFTGKFELNRLDYSVGESSAVLNNTVKVTLSVLAKKS